MILTLYKGLTILGGPLISVYLSRRMAKGKEDRDRFAERLGQPGQPRPDGHVVWLHAASVGESVSLLPLIEQLNSRWPAWHILVTTGTVTSARMMADRLPKLAVHQYLPVDRPHYVKRFLDHWQPDLALWAESEFWPNMISAVSARHIPLVLINGRVSSGSFKTWQRFPGMIKKLLSGFVLCLGQSNTDVERLIALGATHAKCVGNLKFASPPLPADPADLTHLSAMFKDRPRWVAASTHPGEEEMAGRLHQSLATDLPGLLTVIAPRHPERGPHIAATLTAQGLNVALRSEGQDIGKDTDIYLADTLGELGLFYRLCPTVLIGKSVIGQGGQNPLEPARLGCALMMGPNMENFKLIANALTDAGACLTVADETALGDTLIRLLNDPDERQKLAAAARTVVATEDGVLDAVVNELAPYLTVGDDHART